MIFIKLASILALLSASSHAANVKVIADREDNGAPKLLRGGLDGIAITSDAEQGVDDKLHAGGISIAVDNALGTNHCGCEPCTQAIWDSPATDGGGTYTCGSRINYLKNDQGYSETEACSKVGSEFSDGPCGPCECKSDPAPAPAPAPVHNGDQKCGGDVDFTSDKNQACNQYLWGPTGDRSMPCFAYGGPDDPCHLNNHNDPSDGIYKDPSQCMDDTFYLWDEPDTQGHDYTWAGRTWLEYARRFPNQLKEMRDRGTKVTGPLVRAGDSGVIGNNMRTFMNACGAACSDSNDPAYVDIIAVNGFCGPWNAHCRDGAEFIQRESQSVSDEHNGLPVYITNWSRLQTSVVADQLDAIECVDAFFSSSSAVKRVYWFGARDYGGGAQTTGYLTNHLPDGRTLGQVWREKCDSL